MVVMLDVRMVLLGDLVMAAVVGAAGVLAGGAHAFVVATAVAVVVAVVVAVALTVASAGIVPAVLAVAAGVALPPRFVGALGLLGCC